MMQMITTTNPHSIVVLPSQTQTLIRKLHTASPVEKTPKKLGNWRKPLVLEPRNRSIFCRFFPEQTSGTSTWGRPLRKQSQGDLHSTRGSFSWPRARRARNVPSLPARRLCPHHLILLVEKSYKAAPVEIPWSAKLQMFPSAEQDIFRPHCLAWHILCSALQGR